MKKIFATIIFLAACSPAKESIPIRYVLTPQEIAIARNEVDTIFERYPGHDTVPESNTYTVYNNNGKPAYAFKLVDMVPVRYYYDQHGLLVRVVMENPSDSTEGTFTERNRQIRPIGNLTDSATSTFDGKTNSIEQRWRNATIRYRFDDRGYLIERTDIPQGERSLDLRVRYFYADGLRVRQGLYLENDTVPLQMTYFYYTGVTLDSVVLKHSSGPRFEKTVFDERGLPSVFLLGADTISTFFTRQRNNK
jgi:YD repeat-containing protein